MNRATPTSGSISSHGDMRNVEIIEDRSGTRRRHGMPSRYSKGRFLGKGGFAKVYEVQDLETREIFAAKIVAKASIAKPRAHAKLRSEIAIHRSLDHDKVVRFHDYFEDSESVYIILELCPNQTLNEFMRKRPSKRLTEPEAMFYIYDLIVALKYLHKRRVIHRDLKLGNLFLDADVRIKVGDFGLAAQLEHDGEKKRTICGTPNYIAPEILEGKHGHSFEVDIWSLGVILYTMIIGRPPFETSDVKTTYRRIRYNQYGFPDNVRISDPAKELIERILQKEPRSRPSLDDILSSAWFQNSRLPPPVPGAVGAFAISPRPSGNSSARSETPERGVADFARIDSPVPRFPLRDRPPGTVPTHSGSQVRGHSAAPLLPTGGKQASTPGVPAAPTTVPSPLHNGAVTPGRHAPGGLSCGRPPLAHRNDENMMPSNANICGAEPGSLAFATPMSPVANQLLLSGTAVQCRPQSAHLSNCGSAARIGTPGVPPQAGATQLTQSTGALRASTPVGSGRDPSPLAGTTAANSATMAAAQLSGAAKIAGPYGSARSATCSPRQPAPLARLAKDIPTPCRSSSARGSVAPSSSATSCEGGGIFTKTTPAALRAGAGATGPAPLTSRLDSPGRASSGCLHAQTSVAAESGWASYRGPEVTRSSEADFLSARAPMAATPPSERFRLPSAGTMPGSSAPQHTSRGERSSSSPALLLDALNSQRDPVGSGAGPMVACAPSSSSRQCPSPGPQANGVMQPELWVMKWVDYSSKYGVGYVLSDGSVGVYFNDSTKILLVPEGNQFDYVTRRTQEKPEVRTTHTFEDYPEDLKKKVTLLRHFKNYMLTDVIEKKDGASVGESSLPFPRQHTPPRYEPGQAHYVKKWTRNKHAIMFQLSNKIVQVVFFDKTEAVLSSKSQKVTYVDKKSQVASYPLSNANALDVPSPELAKRLRYTKDILVNLMGTRGSEQQAPQ